MANHRTDFDIMADESLPRDVREAARARDLSNQKAAADAMGRTAKRKPLHWCAQCGDSVRDEDCPHWDYES